MLVDPDIPIEYFKMIRVDAMESSKPNLIIENAKLTHLRKPHIVVQDNYIEAHDSLSRKYGVKFKLAAEFTMLPRFESMSGTIDGGESCVVS